MLGRFLDWLYWDSYNDFHHYKANVLDRVPMWFRTRWPMKRWYWQEEDIVDIKARAKELQELWGCDEE